MMNNIRSKYSTFKKFPFAATTTDTNLDSKSIQESLLQNSKMSFGLSLASTITQAATMLLPQLAALSSVIGLIQGYMGVKKASYDIQSSYTKQVSDSLQQNFQNKIDILRKEAEQQELTYRTAVQSID
ncbi:MAG: hypothetical protein KAH32_03390 [Chlamydiia bacterium]|nr:hypothetical protein [Chlamydiia bacterium]